MAEAFNPYGEVERQAAADEVLAPERTVGNSSSTGEPQNDGANAPGAAGAAGGTAGISTRIPQEYTASSYAELIPQLEARMNDFRPPTKEEVAKIRRRQRAEGIIAGISDAVRSVANLAYTTQYAPNMYDGSRSMSARAQARFERERAEREANDERYFNYAMTIGRLRDADKERGLRAWQTEQGLARQDRAFAAEKEARDKEFNRRVYEWNAQFERQGEWHKEEADRWKQQFEQAVREFNVRTSLERQSLAMEGQRIADGLRRGQVTFNLGEGQGNVSLRADQVNTQTVSRIFSTLPQSVRDSVGEPKLDSLGRPTDERETPSVEAMLTAIGLYVGSSPATQEAIRQVAGGSISYPLIPLE